MSRKVGPRFTKQERASMQAAIERDYINGISSVEQLAVRHGISTGYVSLTLRKIYKQWQEQEEDLKDDQGERIDRDTAARMFEQVYRLAGDGYRRSRLDKEEIKTEYRRVKCKACDGTGWMDKDEQSGQWCKECEGEGEKMIEVVTKRVTGQAGDSSFLRVANDSIKNLAMLKALYPDRPYVDRESKSISIGRAQLNIMVDRMPPELILAVKMALAGKGDIHEVRRQIMAGETKLLERPKPEEDE